MSILKELYILPLIDRAEGGIESPFVELFLEHAYCTCSQLFPNVNPPSDQEQY